MSIKYLRLYYTLKYKITVILFKINMFFFCKM